MHVLCMHNSIMDSSNPPSQCIYNRTFYLCAPPYSTVFLIHENDTILDIVFGCLKKFVSKIDQ